MNSIYEKLTEIPVFKGATREFIHSFAEKTPLTFSKFGAGERIARAGDVCRTVKCVLSGRVRARRRVWGGRLYVSETIAPEAVLAFDRLFGLDNRFGAHYTALDVCGTMEFSKRVFIQLLQDNQVVMVNYMNLLSRMSQKSAEAMAENSWLTAGQRLRALVEPPTHRGCDDITIESSGEALTELFGPDSAELFARLDMSGIARLVSETELWVATRSGLLDYND